MNKSDETIVARVNELRALITQYDTAYYDHAQPMLDDMHYDILYRELLDLEEAYPHLYSSTSPTQRVGGSAQKEFTQVQHIRPMLSLSNTYSLEEIQEFDKRVRQGLEEKQPEYVAELKYDGVALSLHYRQGVLVQAATRGDGVVGDDITNNIRTIPDVPKTVTAISVNGIPILNFEVRGEVYMRNDDFIKLNSERAENGEKLYANPRNLTAGTIKLLDSHEVKKRPLHVVCYFFESDEIQLDSHSENLELLSKLGFPTDDKTTICSSLDDVQTYIESVDSARDNLPFMIDGIVLKVNALRQQQELGFIARSPRWAIAYKYKAKQVQTRLQNIFYQVGRTGAVTPVADLQPVSLSGSVVSRATLHNQDFIAQLDLRIGDTVVVEKGGEVIPKVSAVVLEKRMEDSVPFVFTVHCPCEKQSQLIRPEEEANFYCISAHCPWQVRKKIEHFASRKAMDIEGLGEKVVDTLVTLGLVSNITDIYVLSAHYDRLVEVDGWGKKSVDNLIQSISASVRQPYHKVLFALGIRYVGERIAKILANTFPTYQQLCAASYEQLLATNEIGPRIAQSIIQFCQDEPQQYIVQSLMVAGLEFSQEITQTQSSEFASMTFVITGELSTMTRAKAAEEIEQRGGKVSSSVSKKTSFVVAGQSAGSKYIKALEIGVPILNEEDFLTMCKKNILKDGEIDEKT